MAYLSNSPALWRDNDKMVRQFDRFLQANQTVKSSLFLSLGSDENDKMKGAFKRTITALQDHAPDALRWRAQFTPGAKHGNNAELATPVALRWAFEFKLGAIAGIIQLAIVFAQPRPVNRLILGGNIYLIAGGLAIVAPVVASESLRFPAGICSPFLWPSAQGYARDWIRTRTTRTTGLTRGNTGFRAAHS